MLSPTQKKASEAGIIFEFGFKLGLLRCFVERDINVVNCEQIFNFLIDYILKQKGDLSVIKNLSEKISGIRSPLIPSPLKKIKDRSLVEILSQDYQLNIDNEDKSYLTPYVIGTYSGYLFADQIIRNQRNLSKVITKNFGLETITDKGSHLNADLLLFTESENQEMQLYLYELKFFFGNYLNYKLFKNNQTTEHTLIIPLEIRGYTFAPALGHYDLNEYVSNFISAVDNRLESEIIDHETIILLQVLSYLFDFFCLELSQSATDLERINQLCFGYIGGLVEGISNSFSLKKGWFKENQEFIKQYAVKIRKLYEKTKFYHIKGEIFNNLESSGKFKRFYAKFENCYREYKKEALKRSSSKVEINLKSQIDELKRQVNQQMKQILIQDSPWGKAFLFAHSQGSGKTTSFIRNFLTPESPPFITFYFAPRKQLLSRVESDARALNRNLAIINSNSEDFLKASQRETRKGRKVFGQEIKSVGGQYAGKIDLAVDLIIEKITKGYRGSILVLLTTQSICTVQTKGAYLFNTIKHFRRLLMTLEELGLIDYYRIPFVIDEITGSENGFEAVRTVLKLVKETAPLACALLFDASLHSKEIAEKAFTEYLTKGYLTPCLFYSPLGKIEGEIVYDSVPVKVFSGHSYPAKLIKIEKRFLIYDNLSYKDAKEQLYSDVAKLVIDTYSEDIKDGAKSVFVYVQNRDFIFHLSERLRMSGLKVGYFTATGKSYAESLSNFDVILATSTLSRGIDIKNAKTVILVNLNYLNPEQAQVEEVQAVVRLRGNENDTMMEKRILKVYAVFNFDTDTQEGYEEAYIEELKSVYGELDAETVLNIRKLIELERKTSSLKAALAYDTLSDRVLRSFFNPQGNVIVPFGLQISQVFRPNSLSEIEQTLQSIIDILNCLKNTEASNKGIPHALKSIEILCQLRRQTAHLTDVFKNFKFCFPPFLLTEGVLESKTEDTGNLLNIDSQLKRLKYHIRKLKEYAYEIYPEFFNEIESILDNVTSRELFKFNFIVYIPLLAVLNEVFDNEGPNIRIILKRNITRRYLPVCFSKIETNPIRNEEEKLNIRENFPRLRKSDMARYFAVFPVTESNSYQVIGSLYPRVSSEEFVRMFKQEE